MHVAPHTGTAGGAHEGVAATALSSTQAPADVTFQEEGEGQSAVTQREGSGLQYKTKANVYARIAPGPQAAGILAFKFLPFLPWRTFLFITSGERWPFFFDFPAAV